MHLDRTSHVTEGREHSSNHETVSSNRRGVRRLRLGPEVLCHRVRTADTMWSRMKGLLGRQSLDRDEGLWIVPCTSIHMFFMRFAIDAVFVNRDLEVVRVHHDVRPWRMARGGRQAHSVFELPAGTAAFYNVREGDRMTLD